MSGYLFSTSHYFIALHHHLHSNFHSKTVNKPSTLEPNLLIPLHESFPATVFCSCNVVTLISEVFSVLHWVFAGFAFIFQARWPMTQGHWKHYWSAAPQLLQLTSVGLSAYWIIAKSVSAYPKYLYIRDGFKETLRMYWNKQEF